MLCIDLDTILEVNQMHGILFKLWPYSFSYKHDNIRISSYCWSCVVTDRYGVAVTATGILELIYGPIVTKFHSGGCICMQWFVD